MAALYAWLSAQCHGFLNRGSVVAPPTTDTDVLMAASVTNPLNARTSPALAATSLVDNQVVPSTVSPFSAEAPSVPTVLPVPPVVSNSVCIPTLNRLTPVRPVSLKVGQSG